MTWQTTIDTVMAICMLIGLAVIAGLAAGWALAVTTDRINEARTRRRLRQDFDTRRPSTGSRRGYNTGGGAE